MALLASLALAFLSELAALGGAALLGSSLAEGPLRLLLGLAAATLLGLAWGRWAAPRAARRLAGRSLLLFKLAAFALGAAGYAAAGWPVAAWILLLAALSGLVLARGRNPVGLRAPGR